MGTTKSLSDYNDTYVKYIDRIYKNTELRNDLINNINNNNNNSQRDTLVDCDIRLRFAEPNPFQIAIFIWVAGFVWQEFKQIFGSGMQVYLTSHSKFNIKFFQKKKNK